MSELSELLELSTRAGFALALALTIPLVVVAGLATLVAGWIGAALRIRDPMLGHCLRAIALLGAIGVLAEGMATSALDFATTRWGSLGSIEREPSEVEAPR